jgi:hypothetical protein
LPCVLRGGDQRAGAGQRRPWTAIKNASQEGGDKPAGGKWDAIGNLEMMQAMKNHPHYQSELQGENRGRGVSMGYWGNAGMESASSGSVNADGSVNLVLGSVDIAARAARSMQLPGPGIRPRMARWSIRTRRHTS